MEELQTQLARLEATVDGISKTIDEQKAETRSYRDFQMKIMTELAVNIKAANELAKIVHELGRDVNTLKSGQARLYTICALISCGGGAAAGKLVAALFG